MNLMRAIIALVLVVAWVMGYEFYIHHQWPYLQELYKNTASLWRPQDAIMSMMNFIYAGHAVFAVAATFLFVWGSKRGGIGEGIAFGILLFGLMAGKLLVMYAVEPYTMELLKTWLGTDLVEMLGVGILAGLAYKPNV